jgi:AraC-like DNA-binding protein
MLVTGGAPAVGAVARAVRTSPRTLQRRLQEAGLTFAEVLQQARCVAAEQMLRDSGRKIGDVARALGYSDPAHFTRAFVRWTGITPRDFRRRVQNDGARWRQRRSPSVR